MPAPPSHLYEFTGSLVADSSVFINLNATLRAEAILEAIPNRILVTEEVLRELRSGRSKDHKDADLLDELVASHFIDAVHLGESALDHFLDLVSGPASETLGDGEAATIAKSLEAGGLALIDDRKALRICAQRFGGLPTSGTVDLLRHPEVVEALPGTELADAVFDAVRDARMHVPPRHGRWVIELLGRERAELCPSLARILRSH